MSNKIELVTHIICKDARVQVWSRAIIRTISVGDSVITLNSAQSVTIEGSADVLLHKGPVVHVGKTVKIGDREFGGRDVPYYKTLIIREDGGIDEDKQLLGPL